MALKFADLAKIASGSNRNVDSIKDAKMNYPNLTVAVKVIKLENGTSGMVNLERWDDFRKEAFEANGEFTALKTGYKVGPKGYWYDSNDPNLQGGGKGTLVIED